MNKEQVELIKQCIKRKATKVVLVRYKNQLLTSIEDQNPKLNHIIALVVNCLYYSTEIYPHSDMYYDKLTLFVKECIANGSITLEQHE